MNREIKFRGMTIGGEWVEGLLSISQGKNGQPEAGHYISNSVGMPWAYHIRPETVGQFTGLKDKNGKEIYESDILKSVFGIGLVVWWKWGWFIEIKGGHYTFDTAKHSHEIIGNIHQNTGLLNPTP